MALTEPFMDKVHQWTFQHKLEGRPLPKAVLNVLMKQRIALRKAQRFILDDDAVEIVCEQSHDMDRMQAWSFLARLPYAPMWIEFDLHTKIRKFHEMGWLHKDGRPIFDDVSPVMGLLFDLDRNSETRWNCQSFILLNGNPYPDFLSFTFDPAGSALTPIRGSTTWNMPTLSLRPGFPKLEIGVKGKPGEANSTALVDPEFIILGVIDNDKPDHEYVTPDWFAARAAVTVDPWWNAYFGPTPEKQAKLTEACHMHLVQDSGMLRWLVTLLATINGLPRDTKPVLQRAGHKVMGANIIPYFSHHTLSITVPKDNRIRYVKLHMDRSTRNVKRRWHQVIGHWRIIERGKTNRLLWCRHIPAAVENNIGICERCEMLIRWIPAHTRGDPEVGMVDHTKYVIHT